MNNAAKGDDNVASDPYNFLLEALSETNTTSFLSPQTKESLTGFPEEPRTFQSAMREFDDLSLPKRKDMFLVENAPNIEEKTMSAGNSQVDKTKSFSETSGSFNPETYSSSFENSFAERNELQPFSYFSSSQNVEQLKQSCESEKTTSISSQEQLANSTGPSTRPETHSSVYTSSTTELDSSLLDLFEKIEILSERTALKQRQLESTHVQKIQLEADKQRAMDNQIYTQQAIHRAEAKLASLQSRLKGSVLLRHRQIERKEVEKQCIIRSLELDALCSNTRILSQKRSRVQASATEFKASFETTFSSVAESNQQAELERRRAELEKEADEAVLENMIHTVTTKKAKVDQTIDSTRESIQQAIEELEEKTKETAKLEEDCASLRQANEKQNQFLESRLRDLREYHTKLKDQNTKFKQRTELLRQSMR